MTRRALGAATDVPPRVALYVLALSACLMVGLSSVPQDDGLRHVGLAFGPARSWGEVYPHSQLALHGGYDPWGGYDQTLRQLATLTGVLDQPRLTRQLVLVKVLSVAFVSALVLLCLRRSGIAEAVTDWTSLALAVPLLVVALWSPVLRATTIRPFLFGSLLLLYGVGRRGALRGFLASAVALFMYPYLAWMFTVPLAVGHALAGSRSFAAGGLLATVLSTALQPAAYWGLLAALARSESTRTELGLQIGEFTPLFADWSLLVATVLVLLLLIPLLPPRARELRPEHVVMLLFYPLSLRYVRYFIDVLLPLLLVAYGADALRLARDRGVAHWRPMLGLEATVARWRGLLKLKPSGTAKVPLDGPAPGGQALAAPGAAAGDSAPRKRTLAWAAVVAVSVASLLVGLSRVGPGAPDRFEGTWAELDVVPPGSLVITDFNQQYELLYVRPDLSLIPSCEIGFPSDAIRGAYRRYLLEGQVCGLALAVGARYVIDRGAQYFDPADVGCLRSLRRTERRRIWAVEPP